jgi:TolA-binding protein
MDSTLDDKAEGQFASLEEQLSNLVDRGRPVASNAASAAVDQCRAREAGVNPSDPPTSMKTVSRPAGNDSWIGGLALPFVGSLLAASIGLAAWWWSSSVHTEAMDPSDPAHLTQAAPKDAAPTPVALSSDLAQQLQPMARDLAALRQAVEQLEVRQEQLVRDNENVASQLKASQAEMARNNNIVDQIKAAQIQMARESEQVTERLNASQEQLARVIADASEPKVMPEEPKVSPEEPKVMPEIPVPRPRRSTNVAQTHKPAPTPAPPQAKKPQPSSAWPWSVR